MQRTAYRPCLWIRGLSYAEQPLWEKGLLSDDNMIMLAPEGKRTGPVRILTSHYTRAERLLSSPGDMPLPFYQLVFGDSWCKREHVLASRVSGLAGRFERLVYIGG